MTVPAAPEPRLSAASRSSITIRATLDGEPVAGATVQASRPDRPDFRGPGEASAVTGAGGAATLYLPPGKYLVACFWPDYFTGMPHVAMGMWKLVTIS